MYNQIISFNFTKKLYFVITIFILWVQIPKVWEIKDHVQVNRDE